MFIPDFGSGFFHSGTRGQERTGSRFLNTGLKVGKGDYRSGITKEDDDACHPTNGTI